VDGTVVAYFEELNLKNRELFVGIIVRGHRIKLLISKDSIALPQLQVPKVIHIPCNNL
jgi:D-serine dehydratase